MAKVNGVIVVFCCVFLPLISLCNSSEPKNSEHYTYDTINSPQHEQLDVHSLHLRHRRESPSVENATNSQPTEQVKKTEIKIPINGDKMVLVTQDPNGDAQIVTVDPKNPNSTAKVLVPGGTLLGVNGTGQRKEYPIISPSLVSEPITTSNENKTVPSYEIDDVIKTIDVPTDDEAETKLAAQHNFTIVTKDFLFYNSSTAVNAEKAQATFNNIKNMTSHNLLSHSHRRAITVELTFDFPFYGHPVRNITVATGGFLYTGEYVHSWLAATQYIAPLMANFDTNISNSSYVKYADNGAVFTVLWENVLLQDRPDIGNFTFSVSLHSSGNIVFTYFSIPVQVETIQDDKHPVKIGLSDAYIIDKTIFLTKRKTIYEYHRVNFDSQDIANNTIISLTANPTCHSLKDCTSCIQNLDSVFKCYWCPAINKCSTGTDRKRQEWLQKGCDIAQITNANACPTIGTKGNNYGAEQSYEVKSVTNADDLYEHSVSIQDSSRIKGDSGVHIQSAAHPYSNDDKGSVGMALGVFIPIALVLCLAVWVFYAYRNPHTKSGQLLIQYRPSQWSWRRGEARYTAATIHM